MNEENTKVLMDELLAAHDGDPTHRSFFVGEKNRHFHNHMVASVAVWLWILDIVLNLNDL